MDWDKLRIFHAVAESKSLTAAGKTLGLSQSAVSRHITTLEESLGVALFRRHARGLVLTEQGELLAITARDMYARLSMLMGKITDAQKLPEGPLTVTVSEFIGSTWLAPKIAKFREQYPKIQLTVLIDDRVLDLNMKEADAAIRLYKPRGAGLVQRHLTSINFRICGSKSYFEKNSKPKTAADLKKHCLMVYPENAVAPFDNPNWLLSAAGVTPQTHENLLMMNSMYATCRALREGAGIAVMPEYLIEEHPVIEPILPKLQRPPVDMYFIYAQERKNSSRINALRDFILEGIKTTSF